MLQRPAQVESDIHFDLIVPSLVVPNRKQLARLVAHEVAKIIGIKERILSGRLAEKEKEHPSAMGGGIALTHLNMSGLQDTVTVFIRLKNPVDMAAPDSRQVDMLCVLLTPEREGNAYLRTMARLSRLLRNSKICERVRMASDEKSIRAVLEQSSIQSMAA